MEKYVSITDVFKHAVENLHTRTSYEQAVISKNIAELNYLDGILKRNKKAFQELMNQTATALYKKSLPPDILSISAILYKGEMAGLDGSRLRKSMSKNGEWLIQEELKSLHASKSKKFLN